MASATNQNQNVKDRVKDAASTMADKTKDMASNVADKARDTAATVADRAGDVANKAMDKASDLAHTVGEKAESATASAGHGLRSAASTLRENLPHEGMLGAASSSVAGAIESSGEYLEEKGLSGIAEDLTGLIRRNPIPAVLIGVGIGYLIALSTRR